MSTSCVVSVPQRRSSTRESGSFASSHFVRKVVQSFSSLCISEFTHTLSDCVNQPSRKKSQIFLFYFLLNYGEWNQTFAAAKQDYLDQVTKNPEELGEVWTELQGLKIRKCFQYSAPSKYILYSNIFYSLYSVHI